MVFLNFMLCNNVYPIHDNGERILQAASPDEVALVNFGEKLDFLLLKRDLQTIEIKYPNGKTNKFKILYNFPFSSESKRMGIVLENSTNGEKIFFLKGADCVIEKKVN